MQFVAESQNWGIGRSYWQKMKQHDPCPSWNECQQSINDLRSLMVGNVSGAWSQKTIQEELETMLGK